MWTDLVWKLRFIFDLPISCAWVFPLCIPVLLWRINYWYHFLAAVWLFVCSWSKTGSREPLLQSVLSSSFFVFIDAFHSKLNKLCVPLSNNPSSLLSSPIKYAWNENASRELNRAFIAELHTFARAWAEPHS